MTLRGNSSQACAACKYQRRKCTPECPLAPYFPPDQPKMFQNVHKLFGVKKIQKLLENLLPSERNEAMSSIIYQANIRDRFPVAGCMEVLQRLQYQVHQCQEELYAVNAMLAMYRHQQDQQVQQQISSNIESPSQLQLAMATPATNAPSFYLQNQTSPPEYNSENVIPISQNFSHSSSDSPYDSSYLDAKETLVDSMWIQHSCNNENNTGENDHSMPMHSQFVISQTGAAQQETFHVFDETHPYFDAIDDSQSYDDSKETYTSSPDSDKDAPQSIEDIAEDELKNAAACLRLTSYQCQMKE